MTELWHFSEDPSLGRFVPRDGKVWAIDGTHSWLYWFPRDCPRACFWAVEETKTTTSRAGSTATLTGVWP